MALRLGALNSTLQAHIAETERLQQQLRAQTLEDPLTGLRNRRHLMGAGAALLALMHRRSEPLTVVLIDLDHFKRVNDEHGHEAGDQVLCAFAELTRRQTRTEDLARRYGGEEFVLLLPGAQATHAAARIDELRAQFRDLVFVDAAGHRFGCSFSAGVAVSDRSSETLPALLERADSALYFAKQSGRDRVQLAPPPTSGTVSPPMRRTVGTRPEPAP
jgi:diguanylate cyclase (GGDEF)-like protein